MEQYKQCLKDILENGEERQDRTGTGTLSIFDVNLKFDLKKGFPLVTIKETPARVIFEELMFFIRGETNIQSLLSKGVNIWNKDAYRNYCNFVVSPCSFEEYIKRVKEDDMFASKYADLGPVYGKQWRSWNGIYDQLKAVNQSLKVDPHGRRHLVNSWNVSELTKMALPPCHYAFQFYRNSKGLSCKVNLRSSDGFLGLPFNIASYAYLTHMMALDLGIEVDTLSVSLGDAHIYKNHIEQVKLILGREPRPLPKILINQQENIEDYTWDDIAIIGYDPHPAVKGEMST